MGNIFFDDAVTAANLNPNQKYAVFYIDGRYANHWAVSQRCPHAKLFGITVTGITGHGVFACDSETGDLDVPATLRWVEAQMKLGVELICVYANLDRWTHEGLLEAVLVLEKRHGRKVKKWVADFNNIAQIQPWADAEQYADPGLVDHNVALANFFGNATPAPHVDMWSAEVQVAVPRGSTGELSFAGSLKLDGGHWDAHGTPGPFHPSGPGGGQWRIKGEALNSKPLGGE